LAKSDHKTLALLTHILDIKHLVVLEDWFTFVRRPFSELVVIVSGDHDITSTLERLCAKHGAELKIAGTAQPSSAESWDEDGYLTKQFQAAKADHALLFKLDTLPFRHGYNGWFNETISLMEAQNACYITGSTQPFLKDLHVDENHLITERASNNFLVIRPKYWLEVQEKYRSRTKNRGRFASEARLEIHCAETENFGIRRKNRSDWRVFHTQLWDDRLLSARQKFKQGHRIEQYMAGYQDHLADPWKSYYLHPVPPLHIRARLSIRKALRLGKRRLRSILAYQPKP